MCRRLYASRPRRATYTQHLGVHLVSTLPEDEIHARPSPNYSNPPTGARCLVGGRDSRSVNQNSFIVQRAPLGPRAGVSAFLIPADCISRINYRNVLQNIAHDCRDISASVSPGVGETWWNLKLTEDPPGDYRRKKLVLIILVIL